MQKALAADLQELRINYDPATQVTEVRKFYEERDGIRGLTELGLFQHAIRDYCPHAEGVEHEAKQAFAQYLVRGTLPLKVVRCLLPNKLDRGSKK